MKKSERCIMKLNDLSIDWFRLCMNRVRSHREREKQERGRERCVQSSAGHAEAGIFSTSFFRIMRKVAQRRTEKSIRLS